MNANELADLLEVDSWYKLVTRKEIATMLRQQQAKIEALKAEIVEIEKNTDYWADKSNWIPLYTHPADEKQSKFKPNNQVNFELTDEEILLCRESVIADHQLDCYDDEIPSERFATALARAILKKAQEK